MTSSNILTPNFIKKCSQKFNEDDKYKIASNAVTGTRVEKISLERANIQEINHVFSHTIKTTPNISDQENSGRCWSFAFLNTLRVPMINKYHLNENFEFSQIYVFFWDKFEKCHVFLQRILENRDLPLDNEIMRSLLQEPQCDGGDWYMFIDIVEKYGLIPKSFMSKSYQSAHSDKLDQTLNNRLRDFAHRLRQYKKDASGEEIKQYLEECMIEIYRVLVIFLGEPPNKFLWERYQKKKNNTKKITTKTKKSAKKKKNKQDKKGKKNRKDISDSESESDKRKKDTINNNQSGGDDIYVTEQNEISPLEFYHKYVPVKLNRLVSLVHYPSSNRKFNTRYHVKFAENVYGGRQTDYLNVEIDKLIEATKLSIKKGVPVWFGGDVNFFMNNKHGIMDPDSYNTKLLFGFEGGRLNKGDRLRYYDTSPTHAMVFSGYNWDKKNKKINRWKVENSWGDDVGKDGYYTMTDKWFRENVFEVVVDRRFVSSKILAILKQDPVVLPPWDPFGGLAKS